MDSGETTPRESAVDAVMSDAGVMSSGLAGSAQEQPETVFGAAQPAPVIDLPSQTDRLLAAAIHVTPALLVFSTIASGGVLAWMPLAIVWIFWLVTRARSVFLDDHGRESMNFQISTGIYAIVILVAGIPTCSAAWWVGFPVLSVLALVGCILATRASLLGRPYRYPATIRLVSPAF